MITYLKTKTMTSKEISYGILKAVAILAASSIALLFLYFSIFCWP
jgi:hypothetical protein